MESIPELWHRFNEYSNKLSNALGRTKNIVGEYAEYLALQFYEGVLLPTSHPSADIEDKSGRLIQVKSRKITGPMSTQLGIIRSWNFDLLVVVLFNEEGELFKALEGPVEVAKEYGKTNEHQNGWVITTSQSFLNDARFTDITKQLSMNV